MPAFLDTGLNVVHVDDVAEGHVLALERGRIGERYILGGETLPLSAILALVDEVVGRPSNRASASPSRCSGRSPWRAKPWRGSARAAGHARSSAHGDKKMFFSSAKAVRELGYAPRPAPSRRSPMRSDGSARPGWCARDPSRRLGIARSRSTCRAAEGDSGRQAGAVAGRAAVCSVRP